MILVLLLVLAMVFIVPGLLLGFGVKSLALLAGGLALLLIYRFLARRIDRS